MSEMVVVLSAAECRKFTAWLDQEVHTDTLLVEQLSKLGPGGDMMIKPMKQRILAALIISEMLKRIEDQTIESAAEAEGGE